MGFYARHLLPRLLDLACGSRVIVKQRHKVLPKVRGRVLEVGSGTGLNLEHYPEDSEIEVVGLEPHEEMRTRAQRRLDALRAEGLELPVEWLEGSAEEIPADDASFDTVLLTYTLCTIPDPGRALSEMRRVLRPEGRLVFCEHGAAPDASVRRWQNRINPIWRRIAGGCNLNRDVPALIEEAGLTIDEQEEMYLPGWKPATWNVWGVATGLP